MSEIDGLVVHHEEFSRAVGQFALLTAKSLEDQFDYQVGRIVRDWVAVTPPLGGSGSINVTRGNVSRVLENRVRHNLRIFRAVDLLGQRKIPLLFGWYHRDAPWFTPTVEKHPNVEALYRIHRMSTKRGRAQAYAKPKFVDRKKYEALVKKEVTKFGRLGAGFTPAAQAHRVAVPPFVRRHTPEGAYRRTVTPGLIRVQIDNLVPYAGRVNVLRRRIDRAVKDRIGAMERQIPYLLRRHERLLN